MAVVRWCSRAIRLLGPPRPRPFGVFLRDCLFVLFPVPLALRRGRGRSLVRRLLLVGNYEAYLYIAAYVHCLSIGATLPGATVFAMSVYWFAFYVIRLYRRKWDPSWHHCTCKAPVFVAVRPARVAAPVAAPVQQPLPPPPPQAPPQPPHHGGQYAFVDRRQRG